ncbi:hypothetical protein [Flavobacterium sp. Arc2]
MREYIKANPEVIKNFVTNINLQRLSRKEALKNL